jgi:peptidylprolyl isomerase
VRKSLALILSAGLLLSLAACSGSPSAPDCSQAAPSGDASDAVTATGDLGADPAASFPFPLVADEAERSVLIDGDGQPVGSGGTVIASYTIYDGDTGAAVGAPQSTALVVSDGLPAGLKDALICTSAGERVVAVLPKEDAAQVVTGATGSIVMVFDISAAFPQAADGTDQPAQAGFPSVVHDENGRPGITITSGDNPTEAKSTLLKKGEGDLVAEGDSLIVQATAVSYDNPRQTVNSTWTEGTPQLWTMSADAGPSQNSWQPAGIAEHLIGQPIGSEVLVVLPAAESGGSATAYVVDLLGVLPPAAP